MIFRINIDCLVKLSLHLNYKFCCLKLYATICMDIYNRYFYTVLKDGCRPYASSSSSVVLAYYSITYYLTTQLNNGICIVHWFVIWSSAPLYLSKYIFQFYISVDYFTTYLDNYTDMNHTAFGFDYICTICLLIQCNQQHPSLPQVAWLIVSSSAFRILWFSLFVM
jgi:hypothetical protein